MLFALVESDFLVTGVWTESFYIANEVILVAAQQWLATFLAPPILNNESRVVNVCAKINCSGITTRT